MSDKKQYLWSMLGTLSSTLLSVLLLMFSSRLLVPSQADLFSVAYTLAQQLLVIGLFGIRVFQSTDVSQKYSFKTYVLARILTILLMLASLGVYLILTFEYQTLERVLVISLMTCYRTIDAFSDVFQGEFQQRQRSDLSGKILFYRSMMTIGLFGFALLVRQTLVVACILIVIVNLCLTLILDYRYLDRQNSFIKLCKQDGVQVSKLLQQSFPLFFNTFLINYVFTEPRLVIDRLLAKGLVDDGLQRNFNILFMPTFVLAALLLVLRPLFTELAYFWHNEKRQLFRKTLNKLFLSLVGLSLVVLVVGYVLGAPVLGWVFGIDLSDYRMVLVLLLVGGVLNLFSVLIDNVLTIYRAQKYLMISNLFTVIVAKIVTTPLIATDGLFGAAIGFILTMLTYLLTSLIVYIFVNRKKGRLYENITHHSSL